jgi:hypothetical protein
MLAGPGFKALVGLEEPTKVSWDRAKALPDL